MLVIRRGFSNPFPDTSKSPPDKRRTGRGFMRAAAGKGNPQPKAKGWCPARHFDGWLAPAVGFSSNSIPCGRIMQSRSSPIPAISNRWRRTWTMKLARPRASFRGGSRREVQARYSTATPWPTPSIKALQIGTQRGEIPLFVTPVLPQRKFVFLVISLSY